MPLAALGLSFLIAGCVYYPRRVEVYDPDCQIKTKKLILDMTVLNNLNCGEGSAAECLAIIAAIGPITAVVSGSIVVVGNRLYWLEKQGPCTPKSETGQPTTGSTGTRG